MYGSNDVDKELEALNDYRKLLPRRDENDWWLADTEQRLRSLRPLDLLSRTHRHPQLPPGALERAREA